MATIYKFQDSESLVTSSSTSATQATMGATDALLIFNQFTAKTNQTTVGAVSGLGKFETLTTNTSSSFSVTASPYGTSLLMTSSTGLLVTLPAPPQAGLYKTIVQGTSTTTGIQVVCPSTVSSILTTGGSSNVVVPVVQMFFGQQGAYVDLVSVSTSAWLAAGRVVSATALAFTTTTAT